MYLLSPGYCLGPRRSPALVFVHHMKIMEKFSKVIFSGNSRMKSGNYAGVLEHGGMCHMVHGCPGSRLETHRTCTFFCFCSFCGWVGVMPPTFSMIFSWACLTWGRILFIRFLSKHKHNQRTTGPFLARRTRHPRTYKLSKISSRSMSDVVGHFCQFFDEQHVTIRNLNC